MKTNNATAGISPFDLLRRAVITMTEETYTRTDSGKSWKSKPDETKSKEISGEHYYNMLDAVPFFRNLGGTERVERNYTAFGYIPVRLTSVNPDSSKKIVRKFSFADNPKA